MAEIVVDQTHKRLIQAANRPTIWEVGSVALVTVLYTTTPPPPLLAVDNETPRTPRFARGPTLDATTLHDTLGHVSTGVLWAAYRECGISVPRALSRCTLCGASNMQ